MDRSQITDPLSNLLLLYPPSIMCLRSNDLIHQRRLAAFFKAEDFEPVQNNNIPTLKKMQSAEIKTNTKFRSQPTKELINELLQCKQNSAAEIQEKKEIFENSMKIEEIPEENKENHETKEHENTPSFQKEMENFQNENENGEKFPSFSINLHQKTLSFAKNDQFGGFNLVNSEIIAENGKENKKQDEVFGSITIKIPENISNNNTTTNEIPVNQRESIINYEKEAIIKEEIIENEDKNSKENNNESINENNSENNCIGDNKEVKKSNENENLSDKTSSLQYNSNINRDTISTSNTNSIINPKVLEHKSTKPNLKFMEPLEKFISNRCSSLPLEEIDTKTLEKDMNSSGSPSHPIKKRTKLEQCFHINKWGELQALLKGEYNLINQENELRNRLLSEIKTKHENYYKNYLKLQEFIANLSSEKTQADYLPKVFIDDSKKILRDMNETVHSLVLILRKQPRLFAKIIHKQKEFSINNNKDKSDKFESLLETVCKHFFEDLTTEEPYQLSFLSFLDEIIKLEIQKNEEISSVSQRIFGNNSLIDRIFNHMISSEQCERYLRFLLKNPLTSLVKTTNTLEINISKIQNRIKTRRKTDNSLLKPKIVHSSTKSNNELASPYDSFYKSAFESNEIGIRSLFSQQIEDERTRFRTTLTPFLANSARNFSYFSGKRADSTVNDSIMEEMETQANDSYINSQRKSMMTPEIRDSYNLIGTENSEQDLEVGDILEQNIKDIKNLLNIFLDSIFSTIYNVPLNIRLFLKLLEQRLAEYVTITREEIHLFLSNFLFLKWIIPKFSHPLFTGLGFDSVLIEKQTKNLLLLSGILHRIVKGSLYDTSSPDFICFNDFIEENRGYMKEYFEEVVNIGTNILEHILENPPEKNISLMSCFISFENIATVCEYVSIDSYEYPVEIKTLISKILTFDEQYNLFHKCFEMKNFKNLIRPSQIYLLFFEISSKDGHFNSYHDVLSKQTTSKADTQMNLLQKVKNFMRRILISIDKVNTIYTLTGHENVHISEIIQIYQEKSHIYDYTEWKAQGKIPIQTTAKFLSNCIELLDMPYKINNWKRIYEEIFDEYQERNIIFKNLAFQNKDFLSMSLENLSKNDNSLQSSLRKYTKFELFSRVNEKFLKKISLPKCLTSKDMRQAIVDKFKKKLDKKKLAALEPFLTNNKLMLEDQEECIHKKMDQIGIHCFWLSSEKKKTLKEMKEFNSKISKRKKSTDKEFPSFHFDTMQEFVEALSSFPQIKETLIEGNDIYGINSIITEYIDTLEDLLYQKKEIVLRNKDGKEYKEIQEPDHFKDFNRKDREWLTDSLMKEWLKTSLEKTLTRNLYLEVFPKEPTYKDAALYSRIKVYDWIDYSHLDIAEKYRLDFMWDSAIQSLKKIDLAISPLGKLKNMTECFKTIIDSLTLAANKNEGAGADDCLPILIYVILKALPSRLYSNMNFIKIFGHPKRMLSQSGYSFTQVLSAIYFIENLKPDFINVKQEEFSKIVKEKEIEYDIFFKRAHNKSAEESPEDIILLDKI